MNNRVLMVTEKWVDGIPSVGLTNNFHQLFNTFQTCKPQYEFNTLHIDESQVVYGHHIDEILPKYCLHWDINIIFFCLLGNSPLNPSKEVLQQLKELGIYLCFIWPDTGFGWALDTMYGLGTLADLHVSWDRASSDVHDKLSILPNHLKLWAPQDETLYQWHDLDDRCFDVSFVGSRYYPSRQQFLTQLKSKIPSLNIVGGQREDKLSPIAYASKIKHSKIMLNLPQHPLGFWQLKSRVLESMACATMVIELKNPSTSQLFKPSVDYVEAESLDDMAEKAKYYLDNPQERLRIVSAGYSKYLMNYTAQHYWDKIFEHYEKA